jgi:hypothetical protein
MSIISSIRRPPVAKGKAIAKAFMANNMIGEEDLFRSKFAHHVAKRMELLEILNSAGMTRADIARLTGHDPSTISYWLSPGSRDRRKERMRIYRRAAA